MLFLANEEIFATGRSAFLDQTPGGGDATAKIFVRVELAGFPVEILAQLDTGSAWSVLATDVAAVLGLFNGAGVVTTLHTRHGQMNGTLEQATLTFLAEDGESLDVQGATVFVSPDWPSGTFLGYTGLLERVRFALDPQQNQFYFGPG